MSQSYSFNNSSLLETKCTVWLLGYFLFFLAVTESDVIMLETELLIGYEESGGLHLPRDLPSQSWPCRLGVPVILGTHLSVVSFFCLISMKFWELVVKDSFLLGGIILLPSWPWSTCYLQVLSRMPAGLFSCLVTGLPPWVVCSGLGFQAHPDGSQH